MHFLQKADHMEIFNRCLMKMSFLNFSDEKYNKKTKLKNRNF